MEVAAAPQTELSIAAVAAATALTACGSGEAPPPAAFFQTAAAPTRRHILQVGAEPADGPKPTATELFDWAERTYPQYFPDHRPDLEADPYLYRHYPTLGNYLGLAGDDVYVLGPVSGGELLRVGALADFAPLVLATRFAYSDANAARFLQQAQFGSTPLEIAAVRAQGYGPWLEQQFNGPVAETAWDWLVRKGYGEVNEYQYFSCQNYATNFVLWKDLWSAPDAVRKRVSLALSEFFVVSLMGTDTSWCQFVQANYWDLLNANAFGNFRRLLEDVSLSLAMGIYLNIEGSEKEDPETGRQPDENYSREVMQLFTIGLNRLNLDGSPMLDGRGVPMPAFDQSDVRNLARVFTGYARNQSDGTQPTGLPPPLDGLIPRLNYARRPMALSPERHSPEPKQFLGITIPAGTSGEASLKMALDTLFSHPNVGPFFGRQMIQRLVTSHPSPAYVARVTAAFNDNGSGVRGDLRAVWKAVLLDEEARGPGGLTDPTFGKLREPMVRFAQWGRTFNIQSKYGFWKFFENPTDPYEQLGQSPLRAPSVFGWFRPGYVPPGTSLAERQATAPEFQIVNESSVCQYINFLPGHLLAGVYAESPDIGPMGDVAPPLTTATGVDMEVDHTAEMALIPDWPALVARLNLLMCAGQLSAATTTLIADAMGRLWPIYEPRPYGKRWMVGFALLYVMSAPEYLVQK